MRLFEERGFDETTVAEIAAAAGVSHMTFFRYFPNKAALLIPDHMMEPIVEFFVDAPAEMRPIAAYRYALEQVFIGMAGPEWGEEIARQQLLYTLPEAGGALYNEYIHTIDVITDALAMRLNRPAEDPELRITAGAMTGDRGMPSPCGGRTTA